MQQGACRSGEPEGSEHGSLSLHGLVSGDSAETLRETMPARLGEGGPECVLGMSNIWSFVSDSGLL